MTDIEKEERDEKLIRMTTSISSEAQKLLMDIGKKFTTKQCHTINNKLDEIDKSRNFKMAQPS